MQVTKEGSVRVDLLGGTIDLWPINLIIPHAKTLNLATSLKAKVKIESSDFNGIEINSKEYKTSVQICAEELNDENIYQKNIFNELSFIVQILDALECRSHLKIELSSMIPAGSGLGGSSAMGVTLIEALLAFKKLTWSKQDIIRTCMNIEARILNRGPAGYQDYYPALYAGVLSIAPTKRGDLEVKQLYSEKMASFLEKHLSIVSSGIARNSGINNWEVYKGFFDQPTTKKGLQDIARLSHQAYIAIENEDYPLVLELIKKEGLERKMLFPNIVVPEIISLFEEFRKLDATCGLKACGAGGGGCYLFVHQEDQKENLRQLARKSSMELLNFKIEKPKLE